MRQTPLLQAVLNILATNPQPLSVPEIRQRLRQQNLNPNKTTLYRMLGKLVQESTLETLLIDPKMAYYELKTKHHHHFWCDNCATIRCISNSKLEKQIHQLEHQLQASGLKVQEHYFSFSGKCEACV